MKPPKPFKISKNHGWSLCIACREWRHNVAFYHEGVNWVLCRYDYADYWENTDELLSDYKGY